MKIIKLCPLLLYFWGVKLGLRIILFGYIVFGIENSLVAQAPFTTTYPTIEYSRGIDVVKTSDGGYLIAGDTIKDYPENDVYLIKTDAFGVKQWTKTFGIEGKGENVRAVTNTSDGGYVIVGGVRNTAQGEFYPFVYRVDSLGNVLWARDMINGFGSFAFDVIETQDKGFLVATGGSNSTARILKLDSVGNTEWYQSFGVVSEDYSNKIIKTNDNGFIISSSAYNWTERGHLTKLDSNYNVEWDIIYNASNKTFFKDIYQLSDSSYIITGSQKVGTNLQDVLVMKISSQGDSLWSKTFSGGIQFTQGYQDYGFSIVENKDSTLSVLCELEFQISLLKLAANGDSISNTPISYGSAGFMIQDGNSLVITGEYRDYLATEDHYAFLIRTDSLCEFEDLINGLGEQLIINNEQLIIYPNPFTTQTTLQINNPKNEQYSFVLYDSFGRVVRQETTNENELVLQRENLPSGIYFYQLAGEEKRYSGKVIIR